MNNTGIADFQSCPGARFVKYFSIFMEGIRGPQILGAVDDCAIYARDLFGD